MNPLVRRQQAVEATMEKFRGREFALGSVDCMKLVGFYLRRFGLKTPFAKAGPYKSALSAKASLRKIGCETVLDVLDQMGLERIPPASAIIGDIVSCAADEPLGALAIVCGNGRMLGFSEGYDLPAVIEMGKVDIAWRAV